MLSVGQRVWFTCWLASFIGLGRTLILLEGSEDLMRIFRAGTFQIHDGILLNRVSIDNPAAEEHKEDSHKTEAL